MRQKATTHPRTLGFALCLINDASKQLIPGNHGLFTQDQST
jgi:hypothetical protein